MKKFDQGSSRDPFDPKTLGLISLIGHVGVSFLVVAITKLRLQQAESQNQGHL